MNINMSSIMSKANAYAESPKGKARMREVVAHYVADGTHKTGAGGRVFTETDMYMAASKLISVLKSTAQSYDLPASVMRHFDSLDCSRPFRMSDGSYEMFIYFGDDLHRDSLYSDGYDGVRNIVAVLNNGYHAKDYVYGDWDGHSPTGTSRFDGRSIESSAHIRSLKDRAGLHFIQQAVQDFNGNYGSDFNVIAYAGEDYK